MDDPRTYYCPNCGWEDPQLHPPLTFVSCPECMEPGENGEGWVGWVMVDSEAYPR